MTKSEKREQALRHSAKNVRFPDLDLVMRSYDFLDEQASSHVTYQHRRYLDVRCTVVKPHSDTAQMNPAYVRLALDAIDRVNARTAADAGTQEGNG